MANTLLLFSIPFLILLSTLPFLPQLSQLLPPLNLTLILTYIVGLLTPTFFVPSLTKTIIWLFTRSTMSGHDRDNIESNDIRHDSSLYGLDHAVLNVEMPPRTMWMNMGYWKDVTNLPEACEALVEKVLETAGLPGTNARNPTICPTQANGKIDNVVGKKKRRVLLDLGFGCGQQTLYLMNRGEVQTDNLGNGKSEAACRNSSSPFDAYVGITIDKVQYDFAKIRLDEMKSKNRGGYGKDRIAPNHDRTVGDEGAENVDIFCADAAEPTTWSEGLRESISSKFRIGSSVEGNNHDGDVVTGKDEDVERYVLGLDTLYHFHPSRKEIFKYAHSKLQANFMTFDLFLAPSHSSSRLKRLLNTLFLRILTPALGAPFSNFVTAEEYTAQLQEAGYAAESIIIEDITANVFSGLAGFLEAREREMTGLGLKGFTKWQISGWLFRWLSSGDILRAGIVVAKRR